MDDTGTPSIAMRSPGAVEAWVIAHDDSRLFTFLYIGLALVLSVAIGLFWLVAVVAAHFALEYYKQSRLPGGRTGAAARTAWELKLDIALVFFALWLAAYMNVIFGVAGIGAGARAAAQVGSRFAVWQRVIRGVLLSLDDAAQVLRLVLGRKRKTAVALVKEMNDGDTGGWKGRWSAGDKFSIGLGLASIALIIAAPLLTDHSWTGLLALLANELKPFP
ncbi:MAG: hypothetical protein RQ748_06985 [Elusimicrobiales bacterium]|nr:hypothetical protein [Elusimicrobiales bacterium]